MAQVGLQGVRYRALLKPYARVYISSGKLYLEGEAVLTLGQARNAVDVTVAVKVYGDGKELLLLGDGAAGGVYLDDAVDGEGHEDVEKGLLDDENDKAGDIVARGVDLVWVVEEDVEVVEGVQVLEEKVLGKAGEDIGPRRY